MGTAGLQPRAPDVNGERQIEDKIPQRMPDRMSEYSSDRMPDRLSEYVSKKMPGRMPEGMLEYIHICQKHCQIECERINAYIYIYVYIDNYT